MKKSMRTRAAALVAAAASSVLVLSGFDSAMTAKDLMAKAQEASGSLTQYSAKGTIDADAAVQIGADAATATTMAGTVTGSFTMEFSMDPFALHIQGSVEANAMGQTFTPSADIYVVTKDDGTGTTYAMVDTGTGSEEKPQWAAAELPADQVAEITKSMNFVKSGDISGASAATGIDLQSYMDTLAQNSTVAPSAVSVNGKDCYELTSTITGDQISGMIEQMIAANADAAAKVDESSLQMIEMILGGIKVEEVSDYSVDSFAPVHTSVDLTGSDWSTVTELLKSFIGTTASTDGSTEAAAPQVTLTVNKLGFAMDLDTETPVTVIVPDEALAASVSSLSDTAALVESEAVTEAG